MLDGEYNVTVLVDQQPPCVDDGVYASTPWPHTFDLKSREGSISQRVWLVMCTRWIWPVCRA